MRITGGQIHGTIVDSHNDHRIAMMCAIASLSADKSVTILNADAIAKSYPLFYEDFQSLHLSQAEI